jgi:hypothetical protein
MSRPIAPPHALQKRASQFVASPAPMVKIPSAIAKIPNSDTRNVSVLSGERRPSLRSDGDGATRGDDPPAINQLVEHNGPPSSAKCKAQSAKCKVQRGLCKTHTESDWSGDCALRA